MKRQIIFIKYLKLLLWNILSLNKKTQLFSWRNSRELLISCLDLDKKGVILVYSVLCTMLKISFQVLQKFFLKIKELPQGSHRNNSHNLKKIQCTQLHTYTENLTSLNPANHTILVCDPTGKHILRRIMLQAHVEISNSNGTEWHYHPSAGWYLLLPSASKAVCVSDP